METDDHGVDELIHQIDRHIRAQLDDGLRASEGGGAKDPVAFVDQIDRFS
jgi:hypothetical protein